MIKESLIYNCSGRDYWELIYREDYERNCLYEGQHGMYVGEVVNNKVYNSKTGEYIGEIRKGRLMVEMKRKGKVEMQGNFMFHPMGTTGHACIDIKEAIKIPEGYEDFTTK